MILTIQMISILHVANLVSTSFSLLRFSNNNPYTSFGATQAWDEEKNLWSAPHDISHTEADDDRILYNLIVVRDKLDKDSEVRAGVDPE